MGSKRNRLKHLALQLLAVAAVLVVAEAASIDQKATGNLPVLVFRRKPEMPLRSAQGGKFQDRYCAAFRVAEKSFITSAHCLATGQKDMPPTDVLEFDDTQTGLIYDTIQHPEYNLQDGKGDVALFSYDGSAMGYNADFLTLTSSEIPKEMCSVYVMDDSFKWKTLTPTTHCSKKPTKDKVCYRVDSHIDGVDFAVLCNRGTVVQAIYHQRYGNEIHFSDCLKARCWELIQSAKRPKRQDTTTPATAAAPGADAAGGVTTPAPAEGAVTPAPAGGAATPAPAATASGSIDPGAVPLPPPNQIFPNMPLNFPYPDLPLATGPPLPTKPNRRVYYQNPYPGSPTSSMQEPEIPELDPNDPSVPPLVIVPKVRAEGTSYVDYAVEGPTYKTPAGYELKPGRKPSDAREFTVEPSDELTTDPSAPVLPPAEAVSEEPTNTPFPTAPMGDFPVDSEPTPGENEIALPAVQQPMENIANYGYAPEDWRFQVTRKPHAKCPTVAGRKTCNENQRPPYPTIPIQIPSGPRPYYTEQYSPGANEIPAARQPYPAVPNRCRQCAGQQQCRQCPRPYGGQLPSWPVPMPDRVAPGQKPPGEWPPSGPGAFPGQGASYSGSGQPGQVVDPWEIAAQKAEQERVPTRAAKGRSRKRQDEEASSGQGRGISMGTMLFVYMVSILF
ncbi:uncharacterized protein LOC129731931 [Wyeomyia smithii]|uniref:uncharacterized protein LOC129731931 n=1 Tax=Wyeomyia smithii TaxID=174621 RepID=UPI002467EDEE|nr:uncharacterized protein LOC129731931 [Wyeomyia smithii]